MKRYDRGPETERLILRAATADDAEAMFALNSSEEVMRYTGEAIAKSVEEMRDRLANYPDFEKHGFGRWACVDKATNRVIGFAGLKVLEDIDEIDLGYRLIPAYWGRGLATEASLACVRFAFDTIGLDYIIGLVLPGNDASVRVLEKVGMTYEGKFEYDGDECLRYGLRRP